MMHKRSDIMWRRGSYVWLAALSAAALLFSCAKDIEQPDRGGFGSTGGEVRLEVSTQGLAGELPSTRTGSANEDVVSKAPWILVFEGTSSNASFVQANQAVLYSGKTYVTLASNSNPCQLLVISNPPAQFTDQSGTAHYFSVAGLTAELKGKTLQYAVDNLLTPALSATQTTVPYTPDLAIPMSAILALSKIDGNTVINSTGNSSAAPLQLRRMVAKVTASTSLTNFTLLGISVCNTPARGALAKVGSEILDNSASGDLCNYLDAGGDVVGIAAASGNTTAANPVYVYESAETATSVIIKGTYTDPDTGISTTGFYRAAFMVSGSRVDVQRNKIYSFEIKSVSGTGYPTAADAIANATVQTISYNIAVTDASSYDIVDNGQYYLGLSNSEVAIYDNASARNNILAVKVTTDAPDTVIAKSVTASGTGLSIASGSTISVPGSVATTTDVYINLTAGFTSGTLTVNVGSLTKTVKVTRYGTFDYLSATVPFNDDFVTGEVTAGTDWLSLSFTNDSSTGVSYLHNDTQGANIYLFAAQNVKYESGASDRAGIVYLTRSNQNGRLMIHMLQPSLNVAQNSYMSSPYGYIGTFHRSEQTGERVIKIDYTASIAGYWRATVISGADFIKLSDTPSKDTNLYISPVDMNDPTNDATYSVDEDIKIVEGTCSSSSPIFFRVGMKSKLPSFATPRYGLILLQYGGKASPKNHLIWVRQGENDDYVMRPDETGTPGSNLASRPKARKMSPFLLTDPNRGTDRVNLGKKGYAFTDYPSQAGYYFKWWDTYAWDPVSTSHNETDWYISAVDCNYTWNFKGALWETCPDGYSRPGDGNINGYYTAYLVADSEVRQSLLLAPINGLGVTQSSSNTSGTGYYADGFFDRWKIAGNKVSNGTDVAYAGRIAYNPVTMASLFIPFTGYMADKGVVTGAGTQTRLNLTNRNAQTLTSYYYYATNYALFSGTVYFGNDNPTPANAYNIRCVRD